MWTTSNNSTHNLSTGYKQAKRLLLSSIFTLLTLSQITTLALPATFDPGEALSTSDLYSLPEKFSSAAKIQEFLVQNNSFLANYKVNVSFESDDPLILATSTNPNLQPSSVLASVLGKEVAVSDLIWNMSRGSWANGCSLSDRDVCFDNSIAPINPVFLLTIIQKESGLVFGSNAKLDPNSDQAKFLLDRTTGYMCLESERKTSCFDENPFWKYYRGFFRQVYFASRLLRLVERRCNLGGRYAQRYSGNTYVTGNKIQVSGQEVTLKNDITCSFYVYTPHIASQRLVYNVFKQLGGDQNLATNNTIATPIPVADPIPVSSSDTQNSQVSVKTVPPTPAELDRIENSIPQSLRITKPVVVASSSSSKAPEFKVSKIDLIGTKIDEVYYSQETLLKIVDKSRRLKF